MTLPEIENLSAAELKARRAEFADGLKKHDASELATRYLQARYDAKARDEKLAEQGVTIKALQEGNAALTEKVAGLEAAVAGKDSQLAEATRTMQLNADRYVELQNELKQKHDEAIEAIAALENERDLAKQKAKDRRKGLATVAAVINPLLADEG